MYYTPAVMRKNNNTDNLERQLEQAEAFLRAIESDSLISLSISYKHVVECNFTVSDQVTGDNLDTEFLLTYLKKHLTERIAGLKRQLRDIKR